MTNNSENTPLYYKIMIKGHLEARWADWFEGFTFDYPEKGVTILSGQITDQAALRSVLNHISDLGLSLLSVHPTNPNP